LFIVYRLGPILLAVLAASAAAPTQTPDDARERARGFLGRSFPGSNATFPRYSRLLTADSVVVFGRLKSVSATGRKRIAPAEVVEPRVIENGAVVARSARVGGSNFYHARGKSLLVVDGILHGPPASKKLRLSYPLQIEKTGGGTTRYVVLGRYPAVVKPSVFGLWILEPAKKRKGTYRVSRLIAHDEKVGTSARALETFKQKQADYFAVSLRVRRLSDAVSAARGMYEAGKLRAAKAVLDEALGEKLKVKSIDFEDAAKNAVAPYRKKAESLLETLEKKIASSPSG
jgi:hypothetical protein